MSHHAEVLAECIGCKARRNIAAGEVAADDVPICDACGMPMVAVRAMVTPVDVEAATKMRNWPMRQT